MFGDEIAELPTGAEFRVRFTRRWSWPEIYHVMRLTAIGKPLVVKLRSGQEVSGLLAAIPPYFSDDPKVWLAPGPGRKYRKGLPVDQIMWWAGVRAAPARKSA